MKSRYMIDPDKFCFRLQDVRVCLVSAVHVEGNRIGICGYQLALSLMWMRRTCFSRCFGQLSHVHCCYYFPLHR